MKVIACLLGFLGITLGAQPALGQATSASGYDDSILVAKAANDDVRALMLRSGDDGTTPRNVQHYAYPAGSVPAPVEQISEILTEMGFQVHRLEPDGLMFEHESEVASLQFDAITSGLSKAMHGNGWQYDGWDCAVINNGGS